MTLNEIIENIKMMIAEIEWDYPAEYAAALEEASVLLEKQIPKVPYVIAGRYFNSDLICDIWVCSDCNSEYELETERYDYCPNCGQAIDWSYMKVEVAKCLKKL